MNMLLYYQHVGFGPIQLLVDLLIFLIVIGVIWYLINTLAPPTIIGPARVIVGAIVLIFLIYLLFGFVGCSTMESLAKTSEAQTLASEVVKNVAAHYGGAKAGSLAAAGLSAVGEVAQGYINEKQIPLDVINKSPGVVGVSQIVVDYLRGKGFVSQRTVDTIHAAASVAANATK